MSSLTQQPRKRFSGGKPLIQEFGGSPNPLFAAERSVIGALLANNGFFDSVRDVISYQDFVDPRLAKIYRLIEQILTGKHDGITCADIITVAAIVRDGNEAVSIEKLQHLVDDAPQDQTSVVAHAKTIAEAAAERLLKEKIAEASKIAMEGGEVEGRLAKINNLLSGVRVKRDAGLTAIGEYAIRATEKIIENASRGSEVTGLPTGFTDLDAATSGLHGGKLILVAGRPGSGKTAFAFSVANHLAESKDILVVSLEMGGEELAKRMLSLRTGIDAQRLKIGALTEAEWEILADETERMNSCRLHLSTDDYMTVGKLASVARQMKREGRLDMIVVDYIGLMSIEPAMAHEKRERQIGDISQRLKRLSGELDIPIMALVQLNRELERRSDKRPVPSDLRESGSLEQDADIIIMLYRDVVYNPATQFPDEAEILLRKHRDGPLGEFIVKFHASTASFRDRHQNKSITKDLNLQNNIKGLAA